MLSRLNGVLFVSLIAAVLPSAVDSQSAPQAGTVLYAAVGAELIQYDLDLAAATPTRRGSVTLPANVQEAWQHPSRKFLYVAWSSGGASYTSLGGVPKNDLHGLTAFPIDHASGALFRTASLRHCRRARSSSPPISMALTSLRRTTTPADWWFTASCRTERLAPEGVCSGPKSFPCRDA